VAQFNQSLAQKPNDLDALYQVARLHMNASMAIIQKLTDIDPDSFQLHALMGEVYANNNRFQDSLKEYRAALAKRPDAPGLHYALGTALRNLQQIDEAEKEFHAALKEDPTIMGPISISASLLWAGTTIAPPSPTYWSPVLPGPARLGHIFCWASVTSTWAIPKGQDRAARRCSR